MPPQPDTQAKMPRRREKYDDWTGEQIALLVECWMNGMKILEICELLNQTFGLTREYGSIVGKAFRLNLPDRRKTRTPLLHDDGEDLLEITPDHPSYQFLDFTYTDEELQAELNQIYAPPPAPSGIRGQCKHCNSPVIFKTKFQRWCTPCRNEMNGIISEDGFDGVGPNISRLITSG